MPSFTHPPSGCERSIIRRHFPGWLDLGITPNLLTWAFIEPFGSGFQPAFLLQIAGDYRRVFNSRLHVSLCTAALYRVPIEADVETLLDSTYQVSSKLLIL